MQTLLSGRKVPIVSTEALRALGAGTQERAQSFASGANQSFAQMPTNTDRQPMQSSAERGSADGDTWWGADAGSYPSSRGSRISGDISQYGFAANVPRSLIGTESGGNWGARNNETGSSGKAGHYGILQFGHDRFSEAQAAGAVPSGMSIKDFGSDTPQGRAAQVSASNWHFNDIDSRIRQKGFDRYIGQNIGGVTVSWDGMRSMAHLGGFGGLSKFINSGGRSNPADSFGTSLAAYGKTHQSNY